MNHSESVIIHKMVGRALAKGLTVSVYDGEEWALKRSSDIGVIMSSLGSTDYDTLRFRHADGQVAGSVLLVYGNSPEEVVCDHTDNEVINTIVG